ncbi:MAG: hypothetical protein RB292_04150 [Patescibacteria group bacterium]|nr:hypothetical protein [Patescibacteria group bacterium]
MKIKILKLMMAVMIMPLFFILGGCQKAAGPIQNVIDYTSGKVQLEKQKQAEKSLAQVKCQELCQQKLVGDDEDFSFGPCLSDKIIDDWVCDIAHLPRQEIDDQAENQCAAFRTGQAHHFVELDGNCNIIKVY